MSKLFSHKIISIINWIVLGLLFLTTLVFRFRWLDLMPSGLNWDEASYGYNAYSLMKTGADEWGEKYPLFLKSFGDYKPALLSYLQIPFIKLSGLNEIAIRVPIAILGLMSLISWFFIQKKLNLFSSKQKSLLLAIGTVLLAAMPWHIHYSRAAMDPMVSFSFLLMGYVLFLQKHKFFQWLGVFLLMLSMYTYNSARIFGFLLICAHIFFIETDLFFQYKKRLNRLFQIITVGAFFIIIILLSLFTKIGARAQDVFVLSSKQITNDVNESLYRSTVLKMEGPRVFSNKLITSSYVLAKNYLSHFDLGFLYFDGNLSARHGFSRHGNLLLVTLPFLILGIFSSRFKSKDERFFAAWLLLAPLAAMLSDDVPHSGRTLIMLPAYVYFITKGIESFLNLMTSKIKIWQISKEISKEISLTAILIFLSFNTLLYFVDMYRYFPEESFAPWQADAKKVVQKLQQINTGSYDQVYVSKEVLESYIFYAFYNSLDPEIIQKKLNNNDENRFENIQILDENECYLLQPNSLLISQNVYVGTSINNNVEQETNKHLFTETIFSLERFDHKQPIAYIYETNKISKNELIDLELRCQITKKP